jgi:hypothetical protein
MKRILIKSMSMKITIYAICHIPIQFIFAGI